MPGCRGTTCMQFILSSGAVSAHVLGLVLSAAPRLCRLDLSAHSSLCSLVFSSDWSSPPSSHIDSHFPRFALSRTRSSPSNASGGIRPCNSVIAPLRTYKNGPEPAGGGVVWYATGVSAQSSLHLHLHPPSPRTRSPPTHPAHPTRPRTHQASDTAHTRSPAAPPSPPAVLGVCGRPPRRSA